MVQIVTGNLVEVSSAVRIKIFNGVNSMGDISYRVYGLDYNGAFSQYT
jgi:hypothetical protein